MKCEIVQDLLPLYVDDVASAESRLAIDNHLRECQNCQQFLAMLSPESSAESAELDKAKELKNIRRTLRNRVLKISAISAAAALLIGVLGMLGIGWYQLSMPYRPGMITAAENPTGDVNIFFHGSTFNRDFSSTSTTEIRVEIDGAPMRILYFHLKGTIFDRFFEPEIATRDTAVGFRQIRTIDDHPMAENPEEWVPGIDWEYENIPIAAIYYLATDYMELRNSSSPETFMERARDAGAVMVWERPGIDLAAANIIIQ